MIAIQQLIKQKVLILLIISILLISFYIFFPTSIIKHVVQAAFDVPAPCLGVCFFSIFVLTWSIGLFYTYYMKAVDRKSLSEQAKD